jgi:hypothetical protein
MGDSISRQALLAEYDRLHVGEPGRARKMIEDAPSVQPEPIRINLNEPIKVRLTDWGKEIYYHQYDRTNQIAGREICYLVQQVI